MRYNDAIKFIYDLELFGIKMELENITRFLERLGNPQDSFQSIHVAGTNGKGSVCSMLFSILRSAGYNTGLFTSPHLVDFRERVRTGDGLIDKRSLTQFVEQNRDFITDARVTFFELSTALAFWYFQKMGVKVAVVEVGLGGRLDATNILKPKLSVITHIDFDHTKILGTSLEQIAREKAGIIKKEIPLVTGERRPELYDLFKNTAQLRGTTITRPKQPAKKFTYRNRLMKFAMPYQGKELTNLEVPLSGAHQIDNTAIVLKCVEMLNKDGIKISEPALKKGLKQSRWPARFQLISRTPEILLDVAHNPDGARALVRTFKAAYPDKKVILVCGFLDRPDFDEMLREFALITKRAVITSPQSDRAAELEGVIWGAVNAGIDFDVQPIVAEAVDRGLNIAKGKEIVLIAGSHYTVGEAIVRIHKLRDQGHLKLLDADITLVDG